jgi:DNA-binding GntR family transcriptional regulator
MRDPGISKREHIVHDLGMAIADGQLRPSDRVPSEQKLAARYGYSRTTVRFALADLRSLGLVVFCRPRGTFVSDRIVVGRHRA